MITEAFLHHIWRMQWFNTTNLTTTQGAPIVVLHPGHWNQNEGPDFLHATLLIHEIEWHGHVELHLKSAHWHTHKHDQNKTYDNVVLHVVWEDNQPILYKDQTPLPTLELQNRVDATLLIRYQVLYTQSIPIVCGNQWASVPTDTTQAMLQEVLLERIQQKSVRVTQLLEHTQGDWEEACYQLLAYSFGLKPNEEVFLTLSQVLPWSLLKRYASHLFQLEALLFGTAGLCPSSSQNDAYIQELLQEHRYLVQKHPILSDIHLHLSWYFSKLRPAHFPTIRLAQFAALLHRMPCFFDAFLTEELPLLRNQFRVTQSAYWQTHYIPNKPVATTIHGIGMVTADKILINAVVPFLVAYGQYKGDSRYMERALQLLRSLPPEKNHMLVDWKRIGVLAKNAFDTQALMQLYKRFCQEKACLSCKIGIKLLQPIAKEKT
jgi:hypothetical protein